MGLYFLFEVLYHPDSNFLWILLLVSTTFMLLLIQKWKTIGRRTTMKLPPGPMRFPVIGNLHLFNDLPHKSFHRLSCKYGSIMFLKLGSISTLVVSSADVVREIFKAHDFVFSGRPVLYAAKKLSYGCFDITFAPYGEYWREVRKITVLELLSVKRVQSFQAVRKEEVSLMISSIMASTDPINLSKLTLRLANSVICRVALGRKYVDNGKSGFDAMVKEIQDLLGGFCLADFFPWLGWIHKLDGLEEKLEHSFRQLDDFYDRVIDEHLDPNRLKHEVEDIVDVLLQSSQRQSITLSKNQIKGVLTDMFVAGTDTTSVTVVWTMTELIRNPTKLGKAQEEVRQVIGRKEMVEENDLLQLNYVKLVVKETMRLHPPAPLLVPRETTENCRVEGYDIPAGTRVFINAKSIMTDTRRWENPEDFWPERFINNVIDLKGQDFEFLPFGVGRRGCPGINFAVVLIELVLANLLHRFNWELPHGVKREDVDVNEAFGLTMHKENPLFLVAKTVKCV